MRYSHAVENADAEVDITPMIDIVFQLIIFFMVVGKLVAAEATAEITIPFSTQADTQVTVSEGRLTIQMLSDGQVIVGGSRKVTISEAAYLVKKFTEQWRKREEKPPGELLDLPVLVRVDQEASYGDFRQVMAICMKYKLWRTWWVANPPRG